jgi:AraC-like DNA-binding protein
MEAALITGVVFSAFLAALLIGKKEKLRSDYILISLFIVIGITIFLAFADIYNREHGFKYPALLGLSTPFILLHGPLLWFYIRSLTHKSVHFKWLDLLHFIPFIFVFSLLSLDYYSLPVNEKIAMDTESLITKSPVFYLVVSLIAISTQGYYLWGLLLIRRYKKRLKHYYSDIQSLNLSWLKSLLFLAIGFYAAISLLYIGQAIFQFTDYNTLQTVGYTLAAFLNIVIGFQGIRKGNLFQNQAYEPETFLSKVKKTSIADDPDHQFVMKLIRQMENHAYYLNPNLTLPELAKIMEVSPEYLSKVLNRILNKHFYDFVNYYRIEAFKLKCQLPENKNLTLISLAYDSGFNSKATFNRVFKQMTDMTPGQYYRKVSGN